MDPMRAITNDTLDRIAKVADVSKETVKNYILRLEMKPRTVRRIEAALRKLRWTDLLVPINKTGTDG